jgi:hypothetical protein
MAGWASAAAAGPAVRPGVSRGNALLAMALARVAGETGDRPAAATAAASGQTEGAEGAAEEHPLLLTVATPVHPRIRAAAALAK